MEQLFWRNLRDSMVDPVCEYSEGVWLKHLLWSLEDSSLISINTTNIVLPNGSVSPALTITKTRACLPTSIVIDSLKPELLGAILGIKQASNHPLRPLRPKVEYSIESEFGMNLITLASQAGFDESQTFIDIFMQLLVHQHIPVNPLLPQIISSYWSE